MRNQTPCLSHGEVGAEPSHSITSRAGVKTTNGILWSELQDWQGNLVMVVMQKIIHECYCTWFGCHWQEWEDIARISPNEYFSARRSLVEMGLLRVEKIHVPSRRRQVLCHTLDMDAEPPEPGVNLYIWGKG